MLTDGELAQWRRDGCLLVPDVLSPEQRQALPVWADVLRGWAPRTGESDPVLQHAVDGRVVTTENVADHFEALGELLRRGLLPMIAGVLMGEAVVLHSDVIRHEPLSSPPRQLASNAKYVDRHLGCVIAIDSPVSDAIEVARGCHGKRLDTDRIGNLDVVDSAGLPWEPISLAPGSVLWLHRWTPHRLLHGIARSLEVTYSARVQGDLRAAYYVMRRRESTPNSDAGGRSSANKSKGEQR